MDEIPVDLIDFIDGDGLDDIFDAPDEEYRFGNEENMEYLTSKNYSENTSKKYNMF